MPAFRRVKPEPDWLQPAHCSCSVSRPSEVILPVTPWSSKPTLVLGVRSDLFRWAPRTVFAGTLAIPTDIDSAIDVIANGTLKSIDLGRIDGAYFVNAAATGLSPKIAQTVPHKLKRYLGMVG